MKVLVACEYSGRVRDAFSARGHYAVSCDILETESVGNHHKGDIEEILYQDWDLLIAHPPCTYLANSGVQHLHKYPERWAQLDDGAAFFKLLLNANHIPKRCIENPIMHKYGKERIGGVKQSQVIQPWMFGHMEQKATCLWLHGLDLLKPTNIVKDEMMLLPKNERERLHYLAPSKNRWRERSRTYQGIADAMAAQWG